MIHTPPARLPSHAHAEAGLAKGVAEDPLFEVQGLVLAVMAERAAGARSAWAAYVQWIPQDLSHMPMFWTVRRRVHSHTSSRRPRAISGVRAGGGRG